MNVETNSIESASRMIALAQIRKVHRCTVAEVAKAIQRSESEARGLVERLVEAGLVEARGERRGRVYILSAKVYQATNQPGAYLNQKGLDPDQQEAVVLKHVEQRGEIRRSEVMTLCRLSEDQATRLLKRMAEAGKLLREGGNRGARYRMPG